MSTKGAINGSLKVLGLAGLSGIVIIAPNATQGLASLLKKTSVKYPSYGRLLMELKRRGLIHVVNNERSFTYTITPAGVRRLQEMLIDELEIPRPKKWDKKWRIVTFDIPVKDSAKRAQFTEQLQNRGFMMLQKSLWVHPFPCFEQVEQIANHYNLLRYCSLMQVDKLDELSAKRLLRRFSGVLK